MHDIVLIEDLKSLKELSKYKKGFFLRKSSLFFKDSLQSSTITVFINKIEIIRSFEHINILNDVFMFFDVGENIDFIDRTLLKLFILFETSDFNNFDSILLGIKFISSSVHFAVCALANYLVKSVVFDNSDHFNN